MPNTLACAALWTGKQGALREVCWKQLVPGHSLEETSGKKDRAEASPPNGSTAAAAGLGASAQGTNFRCRKLDAGRWEVEDQRADCFQVQLFLIG